MSGFLTYDKQFELIDSIVKSTSQVMPILKKQDYADDKIRATMSMIFDFTDKILQKLPKVLLSKNNLDFFKNELFVSIDRVKKYWEMYPDHKDLLVDEWEMFEEIWKTFYSRATEASKSEKTIFISLN